MTKMPRDIRKAFNQIMDAFAEDVGDIIQRHGEAAKGEFGEHDMLPAVLALAREHYHLHEIVGADRIEEFCRDTIDAYYQSQEPQTPEQWARERIYTKLCIIMFNKLYPDNPAMTTSEAFRDLGIVTKGQTWDGVIEDLCEKLMEKGVDVEAEMHRLFEGAS